MKIATIMGTRPEIIRLSRIIPKLNKVCDHILINTGQNYDDNLSKVFINELGVGWPTYNLGIGGNSFAKQVGLLLMKVEDIFKQEKPDRVLILGDTNSALSCFVAKRMGIAVYHMEAGNRCFDDNVPEEVNRRIIDHTSDIHLPYTERSRANLLREGIASDKIYVIGNPIFEVLQHYHGQSEILTTLGIKPGMYYLVTAHRQENVTIRTRLASILTACNKLAEDFPVIFSLYPGTAKMMKQFQLKFPEITFHEPFNFADFQVLQQNAACVITDSGTVQEECCIQHVRCVTIRDTTERPETVECGSNVLSGVGPEVIARCVRLVMGRDCKWTPPAEYLVPDVSDKVVNILVGR